MLNEGMEERFYFTFPPLFLVRGVFEGVKGGAREVQNNLLTPWLTCLDWSPIECISNIWNDFAVIFLIMNSGSLLGFLKLFQGNAIGLHGLGLLHFYGKEVPVVS